MTQKESLLQQYSHWLQMRNYSLNTYKAYMGTIRKFWQFCEQRKGQDSFQKEDSVQTYLAYRMSVEKRDFSTVNGDYSALLSILEKVNFQRQLEQKSYIVRR